MIDILEIGGKKRRLGNAAFPNFPLFLCYSEFIPRCSVKGCWFLSWFSWTFAPQKKRVTQSGCSLVFIRGLFLTCGNVMPEWTSAFILSEPVVERLHLSNATMRLEPKYSPSFESMTVGAQNQNQRSVKWNVKYFFLKMCTWKIPRVNCSHSSPRHFESYLTWKSGWGFSWGLLLLLCCTQPGFVNSRGQSSPG